MEILCLDLINSRWYAAHKPWRDGLADAGWLEAFWRRWATGDLPDAEGVQRLAEVRALVEDLLESPVSAAQAERVNAFLRRYPQYYTVEAQTGGYLLALRGEADEVGRVLAGGLVIFVELLAAGRIKRCQNPECGWAFYDESKNNTRRWCGGTCASLIKVRRFRSRQKDR